MAYFILGTPLDLIDAAEDAHDGYPGSRLTTTGSLHDEAKLSAAALMRLWFVRLTFSVDVRWKFTPSQLKRYLVRLLKLIRSPVLVINISTATELDVDALCDSFGNVVIGGIMEHIEQAGVHSGDSACSLPSQTVPESALATIREWTPKLARRLGVVGLLNMQYAVMPDGTPYIIEANPRASRTVPFVSKAIGHPLAKYASLVMAGKSLEEIGFMEEPITKHVSVKEAVLPFEKFV